MTAWEGRSSASWWTQQAKPLPQTHFAGAGKQVWIPKLCPAGATSTSTTSSGTYKKKNAKPSVDAAQQGLEAIIPKAHKDKSSTAKEGAGMEGKPGRRIYSRKFLLRMRRPCQDLASQDAENLLTTSQGVLRTAPRPEPELTTPATAAPARSPALSRELRADAPEFALPPAGDSEEFPFGADSEFFQMDADVPSWPFEVWPDAGGLMEAPYWPTDDQSMYVPERKNSLTEKASTRSSTICTTKADGSELEDLESTATAQSVPASPAPQPSPVPSSAARELQVRTQIEYYFSLKNIAKDWYLRSRMDEEGWINLDEIMQFPRIARFCMGSKEAAAVLIGSTIVEVTWDNPPRIRLRNAEHRAAFPRVELELDSVIVPGCFDGLEQPLDQALEGIMYGTPAAAPAKQPNGGSTATTASRKKQGKKGAGAAANQNGNSQRQGDKNWKKGSTSTNAKQASKVQSH